MGVTPLSQTPAKIPPLSHKSNLPFATYIVENHAILGEKAKLGANFT